MWTSFLDALGAIHHVDADGLGLRAGLTGELEWWERYLGWATDGSPPAALAEALAWCRANRPADEPPSSLLWGDVRLGNVVFDPDRLRAAGDPRLGHGSVGPAEMDLAWFLALEQVSVDLIGMAVPGFGDRRRGHRASPRTASAVPLQDLDWHEVFALVRASAVSTRIAILFERAGQRSMFKRRGPDPGRRPPADRRLLLTSQATPPAFRPPPTRRLCPERAEDRPADQAEVEPDPVLAAVTEASTVPAEPGCEPALDVQRRRSSPASRRRRISAAVSSASSVVESMTWRS